VSRSAEPCITCIFAISPRSVAFYCWLKFSKAKLSEATHVKIDPVQHQGKTALSKIERGGARATASFEFQKLIFVYDKVRTFGAL